MTITEQYLEYVRQMDTQDLNIVSEFLVMAATLIDIKSKMLLPAEVNEEGEEEDPRAELVERLLAVSYTHLDVYKRQGGMPGARSACSEGD